MRIKRLMKIVMFIGLFLIFIGAVTYNLEFKDVTGLIKFNVQFLLYLGLVVSIGGTIYYCARYLKDLLANRNTRSLYCFATKNTAITDRCALPIAKKVELHPNIEIDNDGNVLWKKAIDKLREQMIEQGVKFEFKDEQLKPILQICQICGFNYIYYVELKRKWIWRQSKNEEGFERFLDLTFRKWGDEYPDANIHDEELFGALSDAEVGLCWLVKWGDAREYVPIFHSKITLQDAHNEIMLAEKALKKLKAGGDLTQDEKDALKKEAHKGYDSVATENQIKESVIIVQNAYNSQLATQDADLQLENASLKRKLENALDEIEKQRQYAEDLFDTEIAGVSQQVKQDGIKMSGGALVGIVSLILGLVGFVGYLLQYTGWFYAG
jgi:hypothetical protein